MVGPAIPSLMNRTETGGRTVWQTGIQLEAQDASWIGENIKFLICTPSLTLRDR